MSQRSKRCPRFRRWPCRRCCPSRPALRVNWRASRFLRTRRAGSFQFRKLGQTGNGSRCANSTGSSDRWAPLRLCPRLWRAHRPTAVHFDVACNRAKHVTGIKMNCLRGGNLFLQIYSATFKQIQWFRVISNPTCRNQFQELVHPHKCKQVHIFGKGCLRKKVYDKGFAKLKSQGISFDTLPLFLKSKHFKKHLNNVKTIPILMFENLFAEWEYFLMIILFLRHLLQWNELLNSQSIT